MVLMGVCWWLVGFDVVTGGLMVASVGLMGLVGFDGVSGG